MLVTYAKIYMIIYFEWRTQGKPIMIIPSNLYQITYGLSQMAPQPMGQKVQVPQRKWWKIITISINWNNKSSKGISKQTYTTQALKTDSTQSKEKFNKVDQRVPWNELGDQNPWLCRLKNGQTNNNIKFLFY